MYSIMRHKDTHQPPYWVGIRVLTCNTKKQNITIHLHAQSFVELPCQLPHPVPSVFKHSVTDTHQIFRSKSLVLVGQILLLCGNFSVRNRCNLQLLTFKKQRVCRKAPCTRGLQIQILDVSQLDLPANATISQDRCPFYRVRQQGRRRTGGRR